MTIEQRLERLEHAAGDGGDRLLIIIRRLDGDKDVPLSPDEQAAIDRAELTPWGGPLKVIHLPVKDI